MQDDYFCAECSYFSSDPGDCPHCRIPMQSLKTDEYSGQSKEYPTELLDEDVTVKADSGEESLEDLRSQELSGEEELEEI